MADTQSNTNRPSINGFDALGSKCQPKFLKFERSTLFESEKEFLKNYTIVGIKENVDELCSPEPINK